MKKYQMIFAFVLCALAFCSLAQAEQTYTFDELNAAISFPDNYICIAYGEDGAEEVLTENQYMVAFLPDFSMTCSLTALNGLGEDYTAQSDEALLSEMKSVADVLAKNGINLSNYKVVRTENNTFMAMQSVRTADGVTMYQYQYSTLKSNLYVNLTFTALEPFTDQQRTEMQAIASTLQWQESTETTYSEMTLEDAGVSFLRPDQWLYDKSANAGLVTHSFLTTTPDNEKRIIVFLYGNAAPTLKLVTGISDPARMNIDEISKDVVARNIAGVSPSRLQEVEINGVSYYRYRMTAAEDNASSDVMYQYFHLRNGIIYMIQFDAETDDEYYPVFETLLNSIRYN